MKLRGLFAVVLSIVLTPAGLSAQRIEITPFGGYQVGGKLQVQEGDLRISDNPTLGVIFNVPVRSGGQLEFLFAHQQTNMKLTR